MTDEDKMIKKLEEHRDTIQLIVKIGKRKGIDIVPTQGNDPRGDFKYPKDEEGKLIEAIDEVLGHRKHKGKGDVNNEK